MCQYLKLSHYAHLWSHLFGDHCAQNDAGIIHIGLTLIPANPPNLLFLFFHQSSESKCRTENVGVRLERTLLPPANIVNSSSPSAFKSFVTCTAGFSPEKI